MASAVHGIDRSRDAGVFFEDEVLRDALAVHVDVTASPPAGARKHLVLGVLSLVASLGVFALFIVCCWSAAADAQGAIAFVFATPVLGAGMAFSLVLARLARPWRGGRVAMGSAIGIAVLLGVFFTSALVPGLRFISDGMIHLVAEGYELVAGKSPYAADKKL